MTWNCECILKECHDPAKTLGMCRRHYGRWYRHGDPRVNLRRVPDECTLTSCDEPYYANGLCQAHNRRLSRTGSVLDFWIGYELNLNNSRKKKLGVI